MKYPLVSFFTNTPRGGSKPSWTLDLFGVDSRNANMGVKQDSAVAEEYELRYARIRLRP